MPDDEVLHNPFANLDASRLPNRKAKTAPVIEDEDSNAFAAALQKMDFSGTDGASKKKERGFLLADQCSLPKAKKLKSKPGAPAPPSNDATLERSDPDADAFLTAMRNTTPLSGKGRAVAPKPERGRSPASPDENFAALLADNLEFAVSGSDEYLEGHVAGLDEALMNRLRQGQMSPEAHLDLHGLNAEQAWLALRDFMRDSWFKGLRTVLVVPGRGKNSPDGQGVLRRKLQTWLTQEPFKRVVLAFCTARPVDGGPGSVYVLMRKFKKKGRIFWERLPADADLY
ncbi:MAG: Smr/MutS family protein [Desulfovibrio sp.]|nr:Smr/MutS family protein [Desulfovibrio sp.]